MKGVLLKLGVGLLLFFSNPLIGKFFINLWEEKPVLIKDISKKYDYAIVLAGITEPNREPFDRVQFNKGADRIVHAIQLYHFGKVKNILISGGSGTLSFEGMKESHALRDFAILSGVNPMHLIIEDESKNTRENAFNSLQLLETDASILLFTSAFHMKRAQGCFSKLKANPDIFPTDYYGGKIRFTPDQIIIPSLEAMKYWNILFKEWLGILAYKVAGYI